MVFEHRIKKVRFEKPGKYCIRVWGRLNDSWSDRLAGMCITSPEKGDENAVTILTGHLRDQTQLSGVLNSLYDLHLPILLVEYLEEDSEE